MNICPTCIMHGCNLIISKRNKLEILDKLNKLQNFSLYVLYNLPTSPIFFGERLKLQKLIQRMEILIINYWLTFTQQAENSCKPNKLSFILHYLTITQLCGCRKLSIKNLIFHMHTFWIHDPLTIWTLCFTYIFINRISLHNIKKFFPFNFHTNMTYHCKNHPTFIKNGLCPWHFYNPNLVKLAIYISHNLLVCFGFWVNSSSKSITTTSNMAYVKDLRWRRM
jgi:hypothetical protein